MASSKKGGPRLAGAAVVSDRPYTAAILNDIQFPFQDDAALALVLGFLETQKPDVVVLNGDIVDSYQLGSYDKDPAGPITSVEVESAQTLMESLSFIPLRIWVEGNHEDRYRRYLWKNAPALAGFKELAFPRLFKLAEHGFHHFPYITAGNYIDVGRLMVTHGVLVRQNSAYTARAHFERFGGSVIHGHTHRMGSYYKTNRKGVHGAWENGHLCDPRKMDWAQFPDWQLGFSMVHVQPDGMFHVQQLPIIGGRIFYGPHVYA